MRRGSGPVVLLALLLAACGEDAPSPVPSSTPFQARFAVRGRWPGERRIVYALDSEPGPLAPEETRRAIRSALDEWSATGCASFQEAGADEEPALVFGWRRGSHGACVPFGTDPSVAHAGPPAPGTFVHFDAGREWNERTLSLRQAALHEVGHVLGLDHSPDETAVMYFEPSPARAHLAACDLAGIHSLYGGGTDSPGDLRVGGAEVGPVLRAVAPPELSDWALFDTDGDGSQEILVWRTDAAGHGALWIHRFARGPLLARTLGPLYGMVAPKLAIELLTTAEGERLLVLEPEHGAAQARIFDAQGIPQVYEGEIPASRATLDAPPSARRGDLDGDGTPELVERGVSPTR